MTRTERKRKSQEIKELQKKHTKGMSIRSFMKSQKQQAEPAVSERATHSAISQEHTLSSDMSDVARVETFGYRFMRNLSIAAIAGVVVFVGFFFTSDIPDKIRMAKMQPIVVQAESPVKDISYRTDKPDDVNVTGSSDKFSITSVPGVVIQVDKEEMMKYLQEMDDEQFEQFVESLVNTSEAVAKPSNSDSSDSQTDGVSPDTPVSDTGDGNVSSDASITGDGTSGAYAGESHGKSLEDAYVEAEALYPNQIDGSKRLKLIAELNATDYMYYVAEEGDTLIKLSRAFGVPLGQLIELNGIHDADKIPAGMIILFPSDTPQPPIE